MDLIQELNRLASRVEAKDQLDPRILVALERLFVAFIKPQSISPQERRDEIVRQYAEQFLTHEPSSAAQARKLISDLARFRAGEGRYLRSKPAFFTTLNPRRRLLAELLATGAATGLRTVQAALAAGHAMRCTRDALSQSRPNTWSGCMTQKANNPDYAETAALAAAEEHFARLNNAQLARFEERDRLRLAENVGMASSIEGLSPVVADRIGPALMAQARARPERVIDQLRAVEDDISANRSALEAASEHVKSARAAVAATVARQLRPRHITALSKMAAGVELITEGLAEEHACHRELRESHAASLPDPLPDFGTSLRHLDLNNYQSAASQWRRAAQLYKESAR